MDQNNDNTPPAPPPKKKGGRPKGRTNFKKNWESSGRGRYNIALSEVNRELVDPYLLVRFDLMILAGMNPLLVYEQDKDGMYSQLIENPNPNAPSPTFADRVAARRRIEERRDGIAPQSIHIDAMLRAKVESAIPNEIVAGLTPQQLTLISQALALPVPTDTSDAVDAEFNMQEEPSSASQDTVSALEDSSTKE